MLNAARVDIGRDKTEQKIYSRHSGYPGGFRQETLGHLLARRPEEVIRRAVKGMLPRNKLGVQQLRKLKIYAGGSPARGAEPSCRMPADQTEGGEEGPAGRRAEKAAAATETTPLKRAGDGEAATKSQLRPSLRRGSATRRGRYQRRF